MDDNYKHPVDDKKVKFRPNNINSSKSENTKWIIAITISSFFLSAVMQFVSAGILEDVGNLIAICVVLVIIFIGILFDIIGIAVTAADEVPFHAMASRKLYGAKQAIKLIRNANKVSSVCNDVVGDICGVISGTASATIVLRVTVDSSLLEATIVGLAVSGFVAALTVGGKAIGKTYAMKSSNYIVYKVSVIMQFLTGRFGSSDRKKKNSNHENGKKKGNNKNCKKEKK
ncbi:MAG TPA: Mg2+ and Co2+ transporter CorB [Clostridiaceae bacterium]|nr:Mg2+ and Co2+ transporter CorB [Clostridiaceae bacterium]